MIPWIAEAKSIAKNSQGAGDVIWATVDGQKTILVHSPPTSDASWQNIFTMANRWTPFRSPSDYWYPWKFWITITLSDRRETNIRSSKTIRISEMSREQFPSYIFYHIYFLETFDISNQNITTISLADFDYAMYLKYLNLSSNHIEMLPPSVFASLPELVSVDLTNNKLLRVEYNPFGPSVRSVFLSWNPIENFDESILSNLANLYQLNLENIDLSQSPSIYNNTSVEHIDVSKTSVESIYIQFKMVTFEARGNFIDSIILLPSANSTAFKLQELDLSDNSISSLENITHFEQIVKLNLAWNRIDEIYEKTFVKLTKLKHLMLRGNSIKNVNFGWPSLEYLDLSYNRFNAFKFEHLASNLEEIRLDGNSLTEIDIDMKRMAPKLARIGLTNNNFDCQHLTSQLLFIHIDGIKPVFNETVTDLRTEPKAHTNNVRGIGCITRNVAPALDDTISKYLNNKLKLFEKKIDQRLELHDNTLSVGENSDKAVNDVKVKDAKNTVPVAL